MGCTPLGYCVHIAAPCFILCIIASGWAEGQSSPSGDVGIFYSVPLCYVQSTSIAGRGTFDEYSMRPFSTSSDVACPAAFNGSAAPVNITLEAVDGYRLSANYNPVFVVPASSYMYATLTAYNTENVIMTDPTSGSVLNPAVVTLGPDQYYPWTADSTSSAAAPTAAASTTSSICSNTCRYPSDSACDDSGPGAEYSLCDYGTDCADCGSRTVRRSLTDSLSDSLTEESAAAGAHIDAPFSGGSDSSVAAARRLLSFPFSTHGDDDDDDDEAMTTLARAQAGARRLLKGGWAGSSSGRTGTSSSNGGYSSSGTSRFGTASSSYSSCAPAPRPWAPPLDSQPKPRPVSFMLHLPKPPACSDARARSRVCSVRPPGALLVARP